MSGLTPPIPRAVLTPTAVRAVMSPNGVSGTAVFQQDPINLSSSLPIETTQA
jgi:hypothetical protein